MAELAFKGFAVIVSQLTKIIYRSVFGTVGIDCGQSKNILAAVFQRNVKHSFSGALFDSNGFRIFFFTVPVGQLNLHALILFVRVSPGNCQLIVAAGCFDIGNLLAGIHGNGSSVAHGAVRTHSIQFQSGNLFGIFQSFDVVVVRIRAAYETFGTVGIFRVNAIQLHFVVILIDVPGKLDFTSGIKLSVKHQAGGSVGGISLAVADLQAAQVYLISVNLFGSGNFQADCGNLSAGILCQREVHGLPAVGLLAGLFDGKENLLFGAILEDQAQLHSRAVISGRLVIGKGNTAVSSDVQIGLVQVYKLAALYSAINGQRRTTVVCAYLLKVEGRHGAVTHHLFLLGTIIPIHVQQVVIGGFHPPLPGGKNVLEVDVSPFHIAGNFTVFKILHTMAVIEIGIEGGSINDGTFCDIAGESLECGIRYFHVRTVYTAVVIDIFGRSGEIHTLALFILPLISCLIALVAVSAVLLTIEMAAPDGKAQNGVAGFIPQAIQVLAPSPLAAFYTIVHNLMGVQTQTDGVICRTLHAARIVPVVEENGVCHTAVGLVPDPVTVGGVEIVLVGNIAGICNGIIPLDVASLIAHPLQHLTEQRHIRGINSLFLIDKVAVETIIIHDINQLLCIGEIAVFILVQPFFRVQGCSGNKIFAQCHNAVFVCSVDCCNGGNGRCTVFLINTSHINTGCRTSAGTNQIGILPELVSIVGKVIIRLVAVPGCFRYIRGTIVAGRNNIQLRICGQIGIGLRGCKRLIALLQRHACSQFFGIIVG